MNKQTFRFNDLVENKSEYLTRMAPVIDSIVNGTVIEEVGCSLKELLTKEEQDEIKNYVFEQMYFTIREEGLYRVRKYKLQNLAEPYLNHLYVEVWNNFPKFNNPKYKQTEGTCSFRTFVKNYVKNPARTVIDDDNGNSKQVGYKKRIIEKTKTYIADNYGVKRDDITPEMVCEHMENVSTTKCSCKYVSEMMNRMQSVLLVDAKLPEDAMMTEMEEVLIASDQVNMTFEEFVTSLRPVQQFLFCQNYGFCSEKYDGITLKALGLDLQFIELCRMDKQGVKHIKQEDEYSPEYIDKDFIFRQKNKCQDMIIAFVNKKGLDEYDVQSSLVNILKELWNQLSEEYGLEE